MPFGAAIARAISAETALTLSQTDPLTGLLNRRGFLAEASRRIARRARQPEPASLLYIDLDNFKLVNDVHGHRAGDEALRRFADILRDNSRSGDLVGRLGGDEFVVWLDGMDESVAEERAAAIIAHCRVLVALSGDAARQVTTPIDAESGRADGAEDADALLA